MKKLLAVIIFFASSLHIEAADKIPVKVLILPKFEISKLSGDFPGEAQYYYESFLEGGNEYDIPGGFENNKLHVKNGVALYVTGMGKVNSALSTFAVLNDPRFDFSGAYIISTGCGGGSYDYSVMGDVFIISAAVDYDVGHHADIRDMKDKDSTTWFHDPDYDNISCVKLNAGLTDKVYNLVKNIKLNTTENTRKIMRLTFNNAEWACREPKVLRGTSVTGDNYWKGIHDHNNAVMITKTYDCPEPYAVTDMEDVAIALALKRADMLDRFIIIRDAVNMDVFMLGATPENLWGAKSTNITYDAEDSNNMEMLDIFQTAMKNNFSVGSVIINAILNGELQ